MALARTPLARRHRPACDEVEVGRRVAGHIRVAFEVGDSVSATAAAEAAGAEVIAEPTRTPFGSLNSRMNGPGGLQLTLFEELSDSASEPVGPRNPCGRVRTERRTDSGRCEPVASGDAYSTSAA
jgi:hypothetical protein